MGTLIGNGITSEQEFRASGALTDPTTVTFVLREPDGTVTEYVHGTDAEVVKDAVGVYHFSFVPDQVGWHGFRWVGTGAVPLATEAFEEVLPSRVDTD